MTTDPISDLLTRLRNASMVSKHSIEVPHSKYKYELVKLLKEEGYVLDLKTLGEGSKKIINI